MAVDVIPLGVPELGMTRAELISASFGALESYNAETELFYVLLFAYMVAMYIAGSQLTRLQYAIANSMYLLVMANTIYAAWQFHYVSVELAQAAYAQVRDSMEWSIYWTAALRITLVTLSLWFGRKVRHPSLE